MLDGMVFLDCDWFASRSKFSWKNPADVESVYRAIRSQMDFHRREGRNRFVVTLRFEMAETFAVHSDSVVDFNLPVFAFRLSAQPDIVRQRIMGRDRDQKDEEATNAIRQQKSL